MNSVKHILNFYYGKISFGISFWIIFFGLNYLPQIILGYLFFSVYYLSDKYLLLLVAFLIPTQVFTLIGTWRSSKNSNWKILGRCAIVILLLYNVGNNILIYTIAGLTSFKNKTTLKISEEEKNSIAESVITSEDLIMYESKKPTVKLLGDENVNKLENFYKCYANTVYLDLILKEDSKEKKFLRNKIAIIYNEIFRLYELKFNISDSERIHSRIEERALHYMEDYEFYGKSTDLNKVKLYKNEILNDFGYCMGLIKKLSN